MLITDSELRSLSQTIWTSTFQLDLCDLNEPPPDHDKPVVTAFVLIGGAWQGAIMIQCVDVLARRGAARMFDMPENEIERDMINDALGELANMMGGNLKSHVSGACNLSLPAVVNGRDHSVAVPGSSLVKRLAFMSDGEDVFVSILERHTVADGDRSQHLS